MIVDTAGLVTAAEEGLHAAIQAQANSAVDEADAILFLVDGKSGLIPEDEILARALHRADKPITLAINKIDTPEHVARAAEFYRLGYERMRPISAEHGRGAWDALEELVAELPEAPERARDEDGIRIVVVGRPNVGKSSLVNRLVGAERVVVSEIPGTTRDAIDIRITRGDEVFTLIDTAGLRRPGRRTRTAEGLSALMAVRSLERADVALLVIDASEGLTDQDAHIASLVRDRGRAAVAIANKWDLVVAQAVDDPGRQLRVRDEIAHGLRFMADIPIVPVSAKTGKSFQNILPSVKQMAEVSAREIPTAQLNRWLRDAVSRHEPAMAQRGMRRRALKFFYATQTSVRPPTFIVFCTEPDAVKTSYLRFLENRLREQFDLRGTPIRLRLRKRARKR